MPHRADIIADHYAMVEYTRESGRRARRRTMASEISLDDVARELASAMFGAPLALKNEDLLNQYRRGARWALERESAAMTLPSCASRQCGACGWCARRAAINAALAKEPR